MKNRGGGRQLLLLTRNPRKDFCPERPSGAEGSLLHPKRMLILSERSESKDLLFTLDEDSCSVYPEATKGGVRRGGRRRVSHESDEYVSSKHIRHRTMLSRHETPPSASRLVLRGSS